MLNSFRYVGSKAKLVKYHKFLEYFPAHDLYGERFCGGGGVFLNKNPVKYNLIADGNFDVINVYNCIKEDGDRVADVIGSILYHPEYVKQMKKNAKDNYERAAVYLFLNCCTYLGMGQTLSYGFTNSKQLLIEQVLKVKKVLSEDNFQFSLCDYKDFDNLIGIHRSEDYQRVFVYNDPPYVETAQKMYAMPLWTEWNLVDLVERSIASGFLFAISEFKTELTVDIANRYGLNMFDVCERRNVYDKRVTEVLITNYNLQKKKAEPAEMPQQYKLI